MPGTYPAVEVSFAWGVASSSVPASLDWVDESAYVDSVDIKYGSEDEFSEPGAGTLDLTLDNSTGRFDPDNSGGPLYGDLQPLTWVRVRGGDSSVDTDVFYGQVSIEGFRLAASQFSGQMVVQVTVLDMFEQLANTDLPSSVYTVEVAADSPRAWYRLGESSGVVAVDSGASGYHGTYEGGVTFNSRASLVGYEENGAVGFDGVDDVVYLPADAGLAGDAWTVEMWIQMNEVGADDQVLWEQQSATGSEYHLLAVSGTFGAPGTLFTQVATGGSLSVGTGTTRVDDGDPHHIVMRRSNAAGGAVFVTIDGALEFSDGVGVATQTPTRTTLGYGNADYSGSPIAGTHLFTGAMDEVALYDTYLSDARIEAHYAAASAPWDSELTSERLTHLLDVVDFPAGLRTIATGLSTVGPAELGNDALSAVQAVAVAERGDLYVDHHDGGKLRFRDRHALWTDARSVTSQATFGDGSGEVTYSGVDIQDDRIINYATVQRADGATMVASDATSMTQYQRRTLSESGLLIESDAEAQHRANLIVAEKKDRHRRVRSVTLEPAKSTHPAWAQVFAREIGDRVTVKWRPPYGGTYTFDSWIIGVGHSWRPADSNPWRTTFYLQPVPYGATAEPYWIWGTSTWDTSARWGY